MENLTLIGTILVIQFFAWLTPGPNVVLIIRNSLVYSHKTGIWTALGIAMSNFVHIGYTILGLAFVSAASEIVFTIIKFLGIWYLVYLGIKTLQIKVVSQQEIGPHKSKDISPLQAIKTGFLTNILSPKAPPFFLSIFGGVFALGAPLWVIIFLWIAMPITSFLMASIYSMFFTQKKVRSLYAKYQHIANKILGIAMITLAIMLATYK